MAITFVASARSPTSFPASTNNTSTCIINKPTGTTTDDLMVAFVSAGQVDIAPPAGWTLVESFNNSGSNMVVDLYWKFAAAGEGTTYTFTDGSGGVTPLCGMIATYRGVDRTVPINTYATSQTASTTTASDPGLTTTTYPCWILHYRVGKTATVASEGTFSGTGLTVRQRTSNRGGSTQYFAEVYDGGAQVNPGSQAGVSFTSSQTITGSVERTVALQVATRFGTETATAVDAAVLTNVHVPAADTGTAVDTANPGLGAADTASAVDAGSIVFGGADTGALDDNAGSVVKNGVTFKFGTESITSADTARPYQVVTEPITATESASVGIQGPLTSGHRIVEIEDDPGGITIIE